MDRRAINDRIAHDLRAALSPIQSSAYVLRRGAELAAAAHADLVEVIERQARRLADMVDEAREWQNAVAGGIELRAEPLEPRLLLALAASGLAGEPEIRWRSPPPETFAGDALRLQQMLHAMLATAVQRDPAGAPRMDAQADTQRMRFVLEDAGPDAAADALLDAPAADPADGGLGLRLPIAGAIAEAHGGYLRALPRPGGGLRLECEVSALPPLAATAR